MISLKQAKFLTMLTLLAGSLGIASHLAAMKQKCVAKYVETEFPITKQHQLRYAIVQDDSMVVKKLIQAGANVRENDFLWGAPLNLAISTTGNEKIVELILQAGADANTKDPQRNTTLASAIIKKNNKIIELLFKYDVNPNIKDIWGETPLTTAASNRNQDLAELLLSYKATDPNIPNKHGNTPLLMAIENNDKDMVKLLLKEGANPNLNSKDGEAPLISAIFKQNENIVKRLLKEHADPHAKDKEGKSAIAWAEQSGNEKIIRLFRKYIEKKSTTQFQFGE